MTGMKTSNSEKRVKQLQVSVDLEEGWKTPIFPYSKKMF